MQTFSYGALICVKTKVREMNSFSYDWFHMNILFDTEALKGNSEIG